MKAKKDKCLMLRVTKDQHDDLFHHARKLKITVSDLLRLRVFQSVPNIKKSVNK